LAQFSQSDIYRFPSEKKDYFCSFESCIKSGFLKRVSFPSRFVLCSCSYCVYLRVKQASAACKLQWWSAQLIRERLVCTECQSDAMSKSDRCVGEGQEDISAFWTAASAPGCHGSWMRELSSEPCSCPPYSVLFV
uniref:Si:dkey-178e17.3 n=1 Tax=Fundulus heteroclitus TaxID=8078 RepID=A0A3Q2SZ36_FUNHE